MGQDFADRFFFIQKTKDEEQIFNNLFDAINSQIAVKTKKTNKSGGSAYDLILADLCILLNSSDDAIFEKDYNYVMKMLVSKAQNNAAKAG
jgi:hypothetical protein